MTSATRRRAATAIALVLAVTLARPAAAQDDPGVNVDVTRVTLATGGLAEVEGKMDAPGEEMRLAIERALVADVLRTLVVTGDTPVRSVDLEAAEPVGERSVTGRLLSGDLADPSTILRSLIGETVEVRGGARQISGRLLAFSMMTIPGGENEGDRPAIRIAVATEDGRVAYATFETQAALAIEGPSVANRMEGVVPALRASVDDGRRELVVRLEAEGEAGFNFVVPTTVWRPSYRALLGEGDDVSLQGWATLENTTGLDWNGIDLRLAVGTPVAYAQDVYSPLRSYRPDAPFEVGRTAEVPLIEQSRRPDTELRFSRRAREVASAGFAAAAPAPMAEAEAVADAPAELVLGEPAVASSASTIFPVAGKIDLAAGRTLSVPFLDGSEEASRLAYMSDPVATPMDSLEIAFDSEATVPGGLIAVYDTEGFVGDARFAGADGGERTILPFAQAADVNVRQTENFSRTLTNARIVDGTLRLRRDVRRQLVFIAEAKEPMELVIDISAANTEELAAEANAPVIVETVRTGLMRLRAELPEGTTRIDLTGVRPVIDQYVVSSIPTAIIEEVLSVGGAVDTETAARLEDIAEKTARLAEIDRRINTLTADIEDLQAAVAADRENLEAIDVTTPEGAAVRTRIVSRTNEIDGALETVRDLRRERLEVERDIRQP